MGDQTALVVMWPVAGLSVPLLGPSVRFPVCLRAVQSSEDELASPGLFNGWPETQKEPCSGWVGWVGNPTSLRGGRRSPLCSRSDFGSSVVLQDLDELQLFTGYDA